MRQKAKKQSQWISIDTLSSTMTDNFSKSIPSVGLIDSENDSLVNLKVEEMKKKRSIE